MASAAPHRHYTQIEKKIFLDILSLNKEIENKKGDTATIKEKELIWKKIAESYNNSHSITQERTVAQLKKLWSNLKQNQRNAKTKERQSRMMTGGGPSVENIQIDPDVENIVPNLMVTAPVIFSSNMSVEELTEHEEEVINNEYFILNTSAGTSSNRCLSPVVTEAEVVPDGTNSSDGRTVSAPDPSPNTRLHKRKKPFKSELAMKEERMKKLMKYDEELASVRIKAEKDMLKMQLDHQILIQSLEIRAATAKAELQELLLKKELDKI